jgi:calcium-dependent protein kinase
MVCLAEQKYQELNVIGVEGKFGTQCKVVKNIKTKKLYACKIINKNKFRKEFDDCLIQELTHFPDLDHPNIAKFKEYFEDDDNVYIVMELCEGGSLLDLITRTKAYQGKPHITEARVASIMKQLFAAIEYLHDNNFAHCDLKPDNILLSDTSDNASIKLIDFDHAKWISCLPSDDASSSASSSDKNKNSSIICSNSNSSLATNACSNLTPIRDPVPTEYPCFKAPELFGKNPKYDWKCDVWSLGAIMYFMLYRGEIALQMPKFQIKFKIHEFRGFGNGDGQLKFPTHIEVSDEAKDFMTVLMKRNPAERLPYDQYLTHKWFQKQAEQHANMSNLEEYDYVHPPVMKAMYLCTQQQGSTGPMLQVAVAKLISNLCLKESYVEQIESTFRALDTNCDQSVTTKELFAAICKMTNREIPISSYHHFSNEEMKEETQVDETGDDDPFSRTSMSFRDSFRDSTCHPIYYDSSSSSNHFCAKLSTYTDWMANIKSEEDCQKLIESMDYGKDGKLQLHELKVACAIGTMLHSTGESILDEAFNRIDKNQDGRISKEELQEVVDSFDDLKGCIDVDKIFATADKDADGFITQAKFREALPKL